MTLHHVTLGMFYLSDLQGESLDLFGFVYDRPDVHSASASHAGIRASPPHPVRNLDLESVGLFPFWILRSMTLSKWCRALVALVSPLDGPTFHSSGGLGSLFQQVLPLSILLLIKISINSGLIT